MAVYVQFEGIKEIVAMGKPWANWHLSCELSWTVFSGENLLKENLEDFPLF